MTPMRCFAAVELDAMQRQMLLRLQQRLNVASRGARCIPPEQMHLTLKFFGDTDPRHLPQLCEALDEAVKSHLPFEMSLSGVGCFPPRGPLRIVWAGLESEGSALQRIHASVEESCASAGFARDARPFHPHVTVVRVKSGATGLREAVAAVTFQGGSTCVNEVLLFQSMLGGAGPRYTVLSRHALRCVDPI